MTWAASPQHVDDWPIVQSQRTVNTDMEYVCSICAEVVDFIALRSGLTSALYRHVASHTNYSVQQCQHCQRSRTALLALSTMPWQAGMQSGGVIKHISCNSGYTKITCEIHIIPACEVTCYTQVTHGTHLTNTKVTLEPHVLRSPFGARWLQQTFLLLFNRPFL